MEDELSETVEVTSDLESQVAQIFGVGLGYVSEDEVVKHGEIAPPQSHSGGRPRTDIRAHVHGY